ncbi:cellulose synthase operon protein YhjU [Serratia fonticola]|uniref:Cellulose synthase operon protein YhjU n=1 Tax=Serratia fonticola TaxID=47917 RepID=A0A4V6KT69_SERFO|nr:cellulose synthase operon protein YhjU [Serratia fonticola]
MLIINICSLAWADLDAVNLRNHPLWAKMDIMFTNFNSATAYSGPGGYPPVTRQLRPAFAS